MAEREGRLKVRGVSMDLGGKKIIDDISIRADQGELISLLGMSGSGKTTLFNCIAGIYTPTSGKVYLDGRDITGTTGNMSYMLQKDLLLPHKTIIDNVALPLIIRGVDKKSARQRAGVDFGRFGLEGTEELYPNQLSGGMRQRAALLRTYLFSDRLALLDEPFSALDTITRSNMHSWYLDIMKDIDLTTLFITHDINEAILLSDRIYIMTGKPGRIVGEVTVDQPRTERKNFDLAPEFLEYKRRIMKHMDRISD